MAYLDDHPNPYQRQQRERYDEPSGVIVVHTAESALDLLGEDTGAEGVAAFIARRTDPGSYHRLADSDTVVAVARFEMCTYGDGTGSNDHAIHISFACRAADWPGMSAERRAAFITNGARAAAEANTWLQEHRGITVPPRRITRAQSDQKAPGFISHGERDPGRRTDPGPAFPWDLFIDTYAQLTTDQEDLDIMDEKTKAYFDARFDGSKKRDQAHRVADRKIARAQAEQLGALGEAIAAGDQRTREVVKNQTAKVLAAIDEADQAEATEDAEV